MRISVAPAAWLASTTSATIRPIRADVVAPSTPTASRGSCSGRQDARPHRIVGVVVDVGDDVRHAGNLPFHGRGAHVARRADRHAVLALGVPGDAVADLPGEVEARAVVLQPVHDAQALLVVAEPAGHDALRARARRRGRTACGRGRARARWPRSAPRAAAAPSRWSARSATPPGCASGGCGSDRPPARRTPGSCASGGGTPCSGRCGRGRAGRRAGSGPRAPGAARPRVRAEHAACGTRACEFTRLELFADGRHMGVRWSPIA